jgi:hypothetical protein
MQLMKLFCILRSVNKWFPFHEIDKFSRNEQFNQENVTYILTLYYISLRTQHNILYNKLFPRYKVAHIGCDVYIAFIIFEVV